MRIEGYPRLEKSVFIVTYGRSGSTLLQNLMNALPGYLIRGENENLLAPLARAWGTVTASDQQRRMHEAHQVTAPEDPWYGYEGVSADALGAALARSFADTVLRPGPDTRVTGFKEIRWHADAGLFPVMLDFLRAHFPGTRIVFNIRDHDQVARSGWWKYMQRANVERQLTSAEALYRAYAAEHPDACITMNYSAYTQGTEPWKALFAFLGEPYDEALVRRVLDRRLTHLNNV